MYVLRECITNNFEAVHSETTIGAGMHCLPVGRTVFGCLLNLKFSVQTFVDHCLYLFLLFPIDPCIVSHSWISDFWLPLYNPLNPRETRCIEREFICCAGHFIVSLWRKWMYRVWRNITLLHVKDCYLVYIC